MTKVQIDPGPCNFNSEVVATLNDEELAPGEGVIFEYASQNFPQHAACPVISGILKCIEVDAGLALKHDVKITFED